jgi:hypothetical protein
MWTIHHLARRRFWEFNVLVALGAGTLYVFGFVHFAYEPDYGIRLTGYPKPKIGQLGSNRA